MAQSILLLLNCVWSLDEHFCKIIHGKCADHAYVEVHHSMIVCGADSDHAYCCLDQKSLSSMPDNVYTTHLR